MDHISSVFLLSSWSLILISQSLYSFSQSLDEIGKTKLNLSSLVSSSLSTLFISHRLSSSSLPSMNRRLGWKKDKNEVNGLEENDDSEVQEQRQRWRHSILVSVELSVGFTCSPPSKVNPLRLPPISALSFSSSSYIFVIVFFTDLRSSSDETGKISIVANLQRTSIRRKLATNQFPSQICNEHFLFASKNLGEKYFPRNSLANCDLQRNYEDFFPCNIHVFYSDKNLYFFTNHRWNTIFLELLERSWTLFVVLPL